MYALLNYPVQMFLMTSINQMDSPKKVRQNSMALRFCSRFVLMFTGKHFHTTRQVCEPY